MGGLLHRVAELCTSVSQSSRARERFSAILAAQRAPLDVDLRAMADTTVSGETAGFRVSKPVARPTIVLVAMARMMRAREITSAIGGVIFLGGCPLDPIQPFDAGAIFEDAGAQADAGNRDGGSAPDAGEDAGADERDAGADAGPRDAGVQTQDAGFEPDAGTPCERIAPTPFVCEGDEDFCDPRNDAWSPAADFVAAWSHIEDEQAIVELRFASPVFGDPSFDGQISIALNVNSNATDDDVSYGVYLNDEIITLWADAISTLKRPNWGQYPPSLWILAHSQAAEDAHLLDDCGIGLSADGLSLAFTFGDGLTFDPDWTYNAASHGEEVAFGSAELSPTAPTPTTSRGGQQDGVTYLPLCEAFCASDE